MTDFEPLKKLNLALELSATAKLMQQLQKSPFEELRRHVDSLGRADWASRTIRKEVESIDRLKRYLAPNARALQLLTERPSNSMLEQVEAFSKRMDSFTRRPQHLVDQLERFEKLVSSQFSQSLKQIDAFRAATDAQRSWGRYEEIAASLAKLQERAALPPALSQLVAKLDQATRAAEAAGAGDDTFEDFGLEQREQAAVAFEALVQEAEQAPTPEARVDRIIEAIKSTKDSTLQKILWFILIPVLIGLVMSVVNPVSDFYVKKWLEGTSSRQEATKVIKHEARNAVDDLRLISDYRFVDVAKDKPLVVRAKPGAKAARIGELRFSQVIYVVETTKDKDFTLVEWRSEDGTSSVKGWVFSRYLKKFS